MRFLSVFPLVSDSQLRLGNKSQLTWVVILANAIHCMSDLFKIDVFTFRDLVFMLYEPQARPEALKFQKTTKLLISQKILSLATPTGKKYLFRSVSIQPPILVWKPR